MQIFELTQKRNLKEYDPSRSPPGTPNYAAGGVGTAPQMTATPGTTATAPVTATSNYSGGQQTATPTTNQPAPAPAPATATPAAAPATDPVDAAARIMAQQRAAAKPNYSGKQQQPAPAATSAPAATPDYSAGAYNQTSNAPTASVPATSTAMPSNMQPTAPQAAPNQPAYNAPTATVPATNTPMPSNMSATGTPPPPSAATASSLGTVLPLLPASKVGLKAAPVRKANIGGAIANAMMKHNASQTGLGFMLPKDPDNEVYVDRNGQITVGGKPYDAKNPEHQRAAGIITIGGQPYDPNNPQHRGAYLAFKDTAGRGGTNQVKIDKNGKVTVFGQPFDPSNPGHIMAYNQHVLGSSVAQTPPPAATQQRPATPAATQQRPAQPAAPAGSPEVVQALEKMGYTAQQSAALAAKVPQGTTTSDAVKQILQGKITESLTWSRKFDPSATLLKKMKSQ